MRGKGTQDGAGQGEEAFYALIANEMFKVAAQYSKDIAEVHRIFYQVSCKRDKLTLALQGQYKTWT